MAATSSAAGLYRPLIILGGVVLITASLYLAQRVLIPLALAVLLTFILSPVVASLQRRGLWRVPSIILVVLFAFLLLGGVCWALVIQIDRLVAELPLYRNNIAQKVDGLREMARGLSVGEVQDFIKDITEGSGKDDPNTDGRTPDPRRQEQYRGDHADRAGVPRQRSTVDRLSDTIHELFNSY